MEKITLGDEVEKMVSSKTAKQEAYGKKIRREIRTRWVSQSKIYSTGYSSERFGECELCGKRISDVWLAVVGPHNVYGCESCCKAWLDEKKKSILLL